MIPYNVILYEKDKKTVFSVIKPTSIMEMIDNEDLQKSAIEMEKRLKKVFDSVRDGK
jgi:uncharacterized protein (DUF302 family)